MENSVVSARGLGKRFRIGHSGRGDVLDHLMDRLFGRRGLREAFWALRDVTFEVPQGDNFGLVGPNGSGKSTLLKILALIYRPTVGEVEVKGRVVPFLELGWGLLEPQQTGLQNIYFAGTLMGLSRREVDSVLDDIVSFADLEQYLHTPLKYYSTGMQIRLTFAIALHSRPEIFLVDEILAVGDIAFRQKCYDALRGLHRQEDTLVFVSHDLPAMRQFCDHGLFLLGGRVQTQGTIDTVIDEYMFGEWVPTTPSHRGEKTGKQADLLDVHIRDALGRERSTFRPWEPVDICIDFQLNDNLQNPALYLQALGENEECYFGTKTELNGLGKPLRGRRGRAILSVPHIPLLQGKVMFRISVTNASMTKIYDRREAQDFLWVVNTTDAEGKVDFHPEWRFD